MRLEDRIAKAAMDKKNGHNCAQVVVCAFADRYPVSESDMLKFSEAFGGGMGIQSVCGAVSGMLMLAGLENAEGNIEKNTTKGSTRTIAKQLIEEFEKENKSIICKDLKGIETGVVLASCEKCINDAITIFERYINSK